MDARNILLVLSALTPAVALCIYIFKKDRAEKEPWWLLLLLLSAGVLICFPAGELNSFFTGKLTSVFETMGTAEGDTVYLSPFLYRLYLFFRYFGIVAIVEESLKWTALLLLTSKSKHFNSLFDGMIYAIFVSLGFAGFENIIYVMNYGWNVAVMRAFTAVPGHMFDAVFMGYYYSMWHVTNKANEDTQVDTKITLCNTDISFHFMHIPPENLL